MRMRYAYILIALMAVIGVSSASAESVTFNVSIDDWGWQDPDGSNSATPMLVWENTFPLPGVVSISTVMFELAHPNLSDMHLTLTAPDGDEFILARGHSLLNTPPYTAPVDSGDLGVGNPSDGGDLNEVAPYWFASSGAVWNDGDGGTSPTVNATHQAVTWHAGPWAAGDWTLSVVDAWDTIGGGALGSVTMRYEEVPEPTTLTLLGLGGLALLRRQR